MVSRPPQLLDHHLADGHREFVHSLPLGSGGSPSCLEIGQRQQHERIVVFFATLGANIGALINYFLSRWLGRPIIYKFANSRIGHMCLIDEAKVKRAEDYFAEHGALSTFIGRLIPAVRQLISIPAGLSRMKLSTFVLYTTLGAGIWNSILAAIGYYLSKVPGIETEEQLLMQVKEYSHEIGYVFIAIGVAIVAYLIYKGTKKD